jgi:hypothetical protein
MNNILLNQKKNNEYSQILNFSKEFNNITYEQYHNHLLTDLFLFNLPNDEYFAQIEKKLNYILKALPAIKHILAKPIVYLKDKEEIVAVEAVKVINNKTLAHISIHTELWGNITKEGVKGVVQSVSVLRQLVKVVIDNGSEKELHEYKVEDLNFHHKKHKNIEITEEELKELEGLEDESAAEEASSNEKKRYDGKGKRHFGKNKKRNNNSENERTPR